MIFKEILDKGLSDIHFGNADKVLRDFKFWYCYRLLWLRNNESDNRKRSFYSYLIDDLLDIEIDTIESNNRQDLQNINCNYRITVYNKEIVTNPYPHNSLIYEIKTPKTIYKSFQFEFDYCGDVLIKESTDEHWLLFRFPELKDELERLKLLNI